MKEKDYVFNINDYWCDDVDYVEHHLQELEYNSTDKIEIGERVPVLHRDVYNLIHLTDGMLDEAYELADEYSADYLCDLTADKQRELDELILEWLDKNINQPNFFTVKGEKEITVQEFRDRFL
jgi:hypothetical protein